MEFCTFGWVAEEKWDSIIRVLIDWGWRGLMLNLEQIIKLEGYESGCSVFNIELT